MSGGASLLRQQLSHSHLMGLQPCWCLSCLVIHPAVVRLLAFVFFAVNLSAALFCGCSSSYACPMHIAVLLGTWLPGWSLPECRTAAGCVSCRTQAVPPTGQQSYPVMGCRLIQAVIKL
jgi:hypothetical protein